MYVIGALLKDIKSFIPHDIPLDMLSRTQFRLDQKCTKVLETFANTYEYVPNIKGYVILLDFIPYISVKL